MPTIPFGVLEKWKGNGNGSTPKPIPKGLSLCSRQAYLWVGKEVFGKVNCNKIATSISDIHQQNVKIVLKLPLVSWFPETYRKIRNGNLAQILFITISVVPELTL